MARGSGTTFAERQVDLQELVAQAAGGKNRSIYLLAGEPFQTTAAAKRLIEALVPAAHRSFNLETYDGRSTPMARILDSLRMRGLFSGTKVVWLRETTVFLSGEKKPEITFSMFAAITDDRPADAAEKLLTLVALAGWTQQQFVEARWNLLPKTRIKEVFGEELEPNQLAAVASIHAWCLARDLSVREFQDEGAGLLAMLEEGLPPAVVLVLTASTVDARKKLYKRIAESGGLLDLSVARERSGALHREAVEGLLSVVLGEYGKRLDAGARELIVRRAGSDAAILSSELEKLCLFCGERTVITANDVRRLVPDLTESWIFDFTAALAARQLSAALTLLRGLLGQGEPALRLLAMIVREVRLLLIARECLDTTLRGDFRPDLPYPAFQSRVLPRIDAETLGAFGKAHPYVVYKRFQDAARFGAARLRKAIVELAEIDARLKSTRTDSGLLLEAFVIRWCGQHSGAR